MIEKLDLKQAELDAVALTVVEAERIALMALLPRNGQHGGRIESARNQYYRARHQRPLASPHSSLWS